MNHSTASRRSIKTRTKKDPLQGAGSYPKEIKKIKAKTQD